jgi:pyruvate kinase
MGITEGADFVALSFVREAKDVDDVRTFIKEKNSSMRIIAKIETQQAVHALSSIIAASDGIMVARGDLGAEIPFERIPAIQDRIVQECRAAGKPVIVATHMLESMIQQPMPTRAEVTDVAHAATSRADATMLSGETATGKFPMLALDTMNRILSETENHLPPPPAREVHCTLDEREARAEAAVTMSLALHAKAILVFTRTGMSAQLVSKFRPIVPILACTEEKTVQRWLQVCYGVAPFHIDFSENPETTILSAFHLLQREQQLRRGDRVILVSDALAHEGTHVGSVQVRSIA